jgi:hypothetical protein
VPDGRGLLGGNQGDNTHKIASLAPDILRDVYVGRIESKRTDNVW